MGVEIPLVEADPSGQAPTYAYYSTKESLDQARQAFEKVKDLFEDEFVIGSVSEMSFPLPR